MEARSDVVRNRRVRKISMILFDIVTVEVLQPLCLLQKVSFEVQIKG